ncbi:MAG: hypothetical protein Q8M94_20015 [Ignavibacteria bacterium]|nr:hypothetical protein [Ignavibacteria bacterium]
MNYKPLHITISIIRNHFRLLKNWLLFEDNKIVLLVLIILLFLMIPPFSVYFGEQSSINSQLVSILYTLILPIFIASKYLIFVVREDSILLVLFNKKDLFISKQLLISFFTLSIFSLMLLFGIIPQLLSIPIPLLIFTEILLLLFFSWLLPFISLKINFKINVSRSTRFWDIQVPNISFLPVRGVILREFLNLSRENKKIIIKIFINAILINILLVLFMMNNAKEDLIIWVIVLQNFIFLTFVINYSTLNNINLMKSVVGKEFYILKGEFVFWLILFLIYLTFIVIIYNSILFQITFLPVIITILLFTVFLLYVLLVRLAYAENELMRTLIFYLMFIPITIPFYIYKSYRRLKC